MSPATWSSRGAAIGSLIALAESLLALSTGDGLPLPYLLSLVPVYAVVGGVISLGAAVGVRMTVSSSEIPFSRAIVVLSAIFAWIWTVDGAVDASYFRRVSPFSGAFLLVVGIAVTAVMGWRIGARWFRTIRSEAVLVVSVPLVILWLELARSAVVVGAGLPLLAATGLALPLAVMGCGRILSSPSAAALRASSVLLAALPFSAVTIGTVWTFDRETQEEVGPSAPRFEGSTKRRPDVILITLDTLRADRLGLYGYDRHTSPNLEAVSSESLVFRNAISPASWTLPAHASMFTGLVPRRHGAHFTEEWSSRFEAYFGARGLGLDHATLAELLADSGYETAAFVSNFGLLTHDMGIAQGFQWFDDRPGRVWGYAPTLHSWLRILPHVRECLSKSYPPAEHINDRIFQWLQGQPRGTRPLFLFINYMDPHSPYCPPAPFDRMFAGRDLGIGEPEADVFRGRNLTPEESQHFRAVYDGEVSYLDNEIDRLVERLRVAGLYQDALLIVTSDHGEYFGEHHLWGHGYGPYDEVYRVPLFVKYPGAARVGIEEGYVSSLDVFATILDAAGIPLPTEVDSRVLGSETRPLVVEQEGNIHLARFHGDRFQRSFRAVYEYPWKYVAFSDGVELLFDLSVDPGETTNALRRRPDVATYFRDYLREWLEDTPGYVPAGFGPQLSPEQIRRLRALGYLE